MAKDATDEKTTSSGNNKNSKETNSQVNKSMDHRPLALNSPKQRQGRYFEQQALVFLQQQGLTLIAQNWQQPKVGELDLIMLEAGPAWSTLVFIEVRQRLRSKFGDAALSVTKSKQRKVIKTAKYFLQQTPKYASYDCRFDVIAYDGSTRVDIARVSDSPNPTTNDPCNNPPEWLIGAFMASAW